MAKIFNPRYVPPKSFIVCIFIAIVAVSTNACVSGRNLGDPKTQGSHGSAKDVTSITSLRKAVQQDPHRGELWYSLGKLYYRKRDYESAINSFKKALDLGLPTEQKKEAYDKYAWSYYKMGQYDRAIELFNKAISHFPEWTTPVAGRACAYRQKAQYAKAIKDFNHVLHKEPANIMAMDNRGWTYYQMKNYEQALADFKKAEVLSDKMPSWRSNSLSGQGWCHYMKGNFGLALNRFNIAIEIAPDHYIYGLWDAFRGKAFASAGLGSFSTAYALIHRAETFMKYNSDHDLALLHYAAGDKQGAWQYLGGSGYLGVAIQPLSINEIDVLYVAQVDEGGPAQKAGIMPGDIITALAGNSTPDLALFGKIVKSAEPGSKLQVVVSRNGIERVLTVRMGAADALIIHDPLLAPILAANRL